MWGNIWRRELDGRYNFQSVYFVENCLNFGFNRIWKSWNSAHFLRSTVSSIFPARYPPASSLISIHSILKFVHQRFYFMSSLARQFSFTTAIFHTTWQSFSISILWFVWSSSYTTFRRVILLRAGCISGAKISIAVGNYRQHDCQVLFQSGLKTSLWIYVRLLRLRQWDVRPLTPSQRQFEHYPYLFFFFRRSDTYQQSLSKGVRWQ